MTMTIESDQDAASARLREVGLKVTAPRLAVLDVVTRPGHRSAEEVFAHVEQTLPSTSLQAIYGVLTAFDRAGLLRKIEPAGSPARYEARRDDNHHHLVCTNCQRIEDIDCAVGEAPCLTPSTTHGFRIDRAEVTFWGLCALCQDPDLPE